jgi:hypothetical protein
MQIIHTALVKDETTSYGDEAFEVGFKSGRASGYLTVYPTTDPTTVRVAGELEINGVGVQVNAFYRSEYGLVDNLLATRQYALQDASEAARRLLRLEIIPTVAQTALNAPEFHNAQYRIEARHLSWDIENAQREIDLLNQQITAKSDQIASKQIRLAQIKEVATL